MKYNFCKNCGSPIQPGMPNCQRCGAPAETVQAVDENKPMAQPPGMLRQYYDTNNQMQQPMQGQPGAMPAQQPVQQQVQPMPQQPPMQQPMNQPYQQPMGQPMNNMQQPMPQVYNGDDGSFIWAVVGFVFTLVGLILYFVWKDTKPKNAKMAGMGALVGVIGGFILGFILGLAGVTITP